MGTEPDPTQEVITMARRERDERTSTPTAPVEDSTTTTEESTVSTTAPEAEAPEAPATTEAPAETAPDLTAFNAALASAVEEADSTTGDVALAPMGKVTDAYRALDAKGKAAARKVVTDAMKAAMDEMNIVVAKAYLLIERNALTAASAGKGKTEKVPTDPTEAFVQLTAGLRLALNLAAANVPEGVAEDWAEKAKALVEANTEGAQAYLAWVRNEAEDKGEAPETPGWVVGAAKLSTGKSGKVGAAARAASTARGDGERHDIGKHIAEAFEGVESGTFLTIAEIRKHESSEYGSNPPSAGAISARLFPKSGKVSVEGITPTTQGGKKGAVKD